MLPTPADHWQFLTQTLPTEQRQQLAELILLGLADGWGMVEIEFQDHHIKVFRKTNSIPARRSEINDACN
jgi:hypothetical protein